MTKIERLAAAPAAEANVADPTSFAERWRQVEGDILTATGVVKALGFIWEQMETCDPATRFEGLDAAMFLSQELHHYALRIDDEMHDLWAIRDRFATGVAGSEGASADG
jgi:hypothetical protein